MVKDKGSEGAVNDLELGIRESGYEHACRIKNTLLMVLMEPMYFNQNNSILSVI